MKKGCSTPQALVQKAKEYILNLEIRDFVRKSNSQWRNPIKFIEKPNGGVRLVSNLMALYDLVKEDSYEIQNMREAIGATAVHEWFSVLDLKVAFYYIETVEKDKEKTASESDGHAYEKNGTTMEFKNSPIIMQRVMNKIFDYLRGNGVLVYLMIF
ncbi:Retrovirus-related Pol polyprotein from transposon 17.6 [Cucumispora dikerogammari]|nr:Retrovirus-related Pol polyprotein from transposon 17.6 [Cucumispora dikerogammari]